MIPPRLLNMGFGLRIPRWVSDEWVHLRLILVVVVGLQNIPVSFSGTLPDHWMDDYLWRSSNVGMSIGSFRLLL